MGDTFKQSMSKTMMMAEEYIKPVLPFMIHGELIPVEGKTDDELYQILDRLAGIDYFCVDGDISYGVASRIQVGKSWDTFTVRKSRDSGASTEYAKRLNAIEKDGIIFPKLTYQAYVSKDTGGKLQTMAVCLTRELIEFCRDGHASIRHTGKSQVGGAEFFVCKWSEMTRCGCKMRVLQSDGNVFLYNCGPEPILEGRYV